VKIFLLLFYKYFILVLKMKLKRFKYFLKNFLAIVGNSNKVQSRHGHVTKNCYHQTSSSLQGKKKK